LSKRAKEEKDLTKMFALTSERGAYFLNNSNRLQRNTRTIRTRSVAKNGAKADDDEKIFLLQKRHIHQITKRDIFKVLLLFYAQRATSAEEEESRIIVGPSSKQMTLEQYKLRLRLVREDLIEIKARLKSVNTTMSDEEEFDDKFGGTIDGNECKEIRKLLHENNIGNFWEIALGANTYLNSGIKSGFAREEEDLWKLAPKKSNAISDFLTPDFNNADDKLCLIYSCVNDPSAPPSIDTLYALKLFDEGLKEGANGKFVTRDGFYEVCSDVLEKLQTYELLIETAADPSRKIASWTNPAFSKGWHGTGI
jgi:hypothetical protein